MAVSQLGTPSVGSNEGSSSISVNHTVASGSNRVTYIAIHVANDATVSSPSFAGATPTLMNTPGDGDMHVYRVVSPTEGATAFTATLSDTVRWSCHIYSLQGVDIADPDDTLVEQDLHDPAAVTPNTVVVGTATGDRVVGFGLIVGANIAPHTGNTLVNEVEGIGGAYASSIMVFQDGNGTLTSGFSSTDSCCDSYLIAWNVNAAASGAAYTITCDQGSYSLTGTDAGLVKQTPTMAAEYGSYTLLGSDAYREIQVNMEQGAYALAGQDAGLSTPVQNLSIVCESGTYTYTGSEAYRDIYENMEAGSYALSGQTVNLTRNFILALDQGSYSMSGFPAGLIWDGQPDAPPQRPIMRRRFFGSRLGR